MGLKTYRGNQFEHTHENKVFNELYDLLETHCRNNNENWYLLGNFYVGGRELDALLIKPNAITIIDFKDFGGNLEYSVNHPWKIGEVPVRGGSSVNPFIQLNRNRYALNDFFEKHFSKLKCNWMHISVAVVFHKQIEYDKSLLQAPIDRWFHITDMQRVVRDLESIVSNQISLSSNEIDKIISILGIEVYKPDEAIRIRHLAKDIEDKCGKSFELTGARKAALEEFTIWLENRNGVFSLNGMASTGKRTLLYYFIEAIKKINLKPLILLPNTRLALHYKNQINLEEINSIYTWQYSNMPGRFEKYNDRELAIYEIKEDLSLNNLLPIIMESHLFTDDEFEIRDRRYGSGRLITDFLEVIKKAEKNYFVLIGDPYQLTKGSKQHSFFSETILGEAGFITKKFELNEQVSTDEVDDGLSKLQVYLVDSIIKNRFNYLPRYSGKKLEIISAESSSIWTPDVNNTNAESLMVVGTHEQVKNNNIVVKKDILHHKNISMIGPNDRIDFYNRTPILEEDDDTNFKHGEQNRFINIGELGIVDYVEDEIETVKQSLSGRDKPILLRFQKAFCRVKGLGQVQFRYLLNFFESERPELDADLYIALQAYALKRAKPILDDQMPKKNSEDYESERKRYKIFEYKVLQDQGYYSAALIRLAHAMTVHRAQGRIWPTLWIKAERSASSIKPNNADYFRWLYTASICAEEKFCIVNLPCLDPLINSVVSKAKDFSIASMKTSIALFYNQSRQPSEQEIFLSKPTGFRNDDLLVLYLELRDRLEGSSWEMHNWQEFDFQVVITFKNNNTNNEVRIRMHYNKKHAVTNVVFLDGFESDQHELFNNLSGKFQPGSEYMAEAVDALERRIARYGFKITGGSESNYRVLLSLARNEESLEVEVNANKEGMISSIRLLKASSDVLVKLFEEAVVNLDNL